MATAQLLNNISERSVKPIMTVYRAPAMKYWLASFLLIMVGLLCGPASAQVYGGFVAGTAEPRNNGDIEVEDFPPLEGGTGFKIYIGNQLSAAFAFELSFIDLGEYNVGNVEAAEPDPDEIGDTIAVTAYEFSVVGELPMTKKASLYGRLGVFRWEAERIILSSAGLGGALIETTTSFAETDLGLGMGARYAFMHNVGATVEANAYKTDDVYNILYGLGFYFTF